MTESVRNEGARGQRWIRRLVVVLLTATGPMMATGCAINPATGARQFTLFSEAQEIEMGRAYDPEIVAEMGLYQDDGLQSYIQELGTRLAAESERPDLPWTFRVLDDPVVNAFALPGGYIYVTRGILAHLNSEAALTGVLGHEIGHVTARHSVSRMSTQQLAQLGLTIGSAIRPDLEGLAGLASAGLQLAFLKYSRDDERQADDLGVRYMLRANYDPREMPQVFDMLERVTRDAGGGTTPEWLATHPNPGNRRDRIDQQVAAYEGDLTTTVAGRDHYLRRLDGLIYGENPREGFFRDSEFLHPDLAFSYTFPDGWQMVNQRQAVLAMSPEQDAMIQITLTDAADPASAADDFLGGDGLSAGLISRLQVNGLPAATGLFTAATEGGAELHGRALFIAHRDAVYQILAYSIAERWTEYNDLIQRSVMSFQNLTDPEVLSVQPQRIELVTIDEPMTIREFASRYPSTIPVERVALINHADPETRFERGATLKRVR